MATFQDPLEEEVETSKESDDLIEKIENASSKEEIDAIKKEIENPASEPETPEKEKVEPENLEKDKPTPEVEKPKEEKPEDKTPPETPAPETPEKDKVETDKGLVEITDEYIEKADPKDKIILQAIKGETLSPKALNNYINAQRTIGKKAQEVFKVPENIEQKNYPPQPKKDEDPLKVKESYVLAELRRKFPTVEFPETLDKNDPKYKQFVVDMNYNDPDTYSEIKDSIKEVSTQIDKDYQEVNFIRTNYAKINDNIVGAEISLIETEAKKYGIENLKDFGLDLTRDAEGNNPILNELLFDKDGNPDPNVMQFGREGTPLAGVPLIKEQALAVKFFRTKFPEIIKQRVEQTKVNSRKEGFESANNKKKEIPTTLVGADVKGKSVQKGVKDYTEEDIENLPPDVVKKLLQQSEKGV